VSSTISLPRRVYNFLGSLWFLIILLSTTLAILIAGSFFGVDITIGALRRDWYGAWWFNIIMALLMVNLVVCTVKRTPWKYFWMWGFLITHSGILTLMIGIAVTFNSKIYGDLRAVEGRSYDYFTIENENEIRVRTSDGEQAAFPLTYSRYTPSTARKAYKLRDSDIYIHVAEYQPHVVHDPTYEETPGGRETVAEIAVYEGDDAPKRTVLKRNESLNYGPLGFFLTTLSDAVFENLSGPAGEEGTLAVAIGGENREIDLAAQKDKPVAVGSAQVTVREWGTPTEKTPDYWVRFEVARDGRPPETYYAFAFHPENSPSTSLSVGSPAATVEIQARFRVRYRIGQEHGSGTKGVIFLCRTDAGLRYLFMNSKGEKQHGPLEPGRRLKYPFMAMPFEIELVKWMDRAEETVRPAAPKQNQPLIPALKVTVASGDQRDTKWVKFYTEGAVFEAGGRRVHVLFEGRRYEMPFTLSLEDFRVAFNKGTMSARKFESAVTLHDTDTGEVSKATIEVNTPMKHKGFVIYQASWVPEDHRVSIFQISWDPGKRIIYLGWIMAISGAIFMFFLKPFLQKLIKAGSQASDPPLAPAGALALFALATFGTIAGMITSLLFRDVDALWLGFGIAGADLLLALVLALIAGRWRTRRPVRSLQTGEVLSAGWCLNTAALVILILMRVTA
jgi:hypothetical protein